MTVSSPKTVKYKPFAKRLETAVLNNPNAPDGHGRQAWLRAKLQEKFNFSVTPEGVRRWFAGEARPRPDVMKLVAATLGVDEAWLSLGLSQGQTKREPTSHSVSASGAINYVAGLIQLSGGQIAFNESDEEDLPFDFLAIVKGRRYNVKVLMLTTTTDGKAAAHVPSGYNESLLVALVPTSNPLVYTCLRIPSEVVKSAGRPRDGYIDVDLELTETSARVGGVELPAIVRFDDIMGERSTTDNQSQPSRHRVRRALDLSDPSEG